MLETLLTAACVLGATSVARAEARDVREPTAMGYVLVTRYRDLATNVVMSGCIFRGGRGFGVANQIGVAGGVNHTVRENRFTNCHVALMLLGKSVQWPDEAVATPNRQRLTQNDFHCTDKVQQYRRDRGLSPAGAFLGEAEDGLLDAAKATGCVFEEPTLSNIGSAD